MSTDSYYTNMTNKIMKEIDKMFETEELIDQGFAPIMDAESLKSYIADENQPLSELIQFIDEVGLIVATDENVPNVIPDNAEVILHEDYISIESSAEIPTPRNRRINVSSDVFSFNEGFQINERDDPVRRTATAMEPCAFTFSELLLAEMLCPVNEDVTDEVCTYLPGEESIVAFYLERFYKLAEKYLQLARSSQNLLTRSHVSANEEQEIDEEFFTLFDEDDDSEDKENWRKFNFEMKRVNFIHRRLKARKDGNERKSSLGELFLEANFKKIIKYIFLTSNLKKMKKEWNVNIKPTNIAERDITKFYNRYEANLIKLKGLTKEHKIHAFTHKHKHHSLERLFKLTSDHLITTELFEQVDVVDAEDVDQLLKSGYFAISKFGRMCPVMLLENRRKKTGQTFHLVHRRHIYFVDSPEGKDKFINNPLKYICQNSYQPPACMKTLILGNPMTNKTYAGLALKNHFGLPHVTVSEAIHFVLSRMPWTSLSHTIYAFAHTYELMPPYVSVKCLRTWINTFHEHPIGWSIIGLGPTEMNVEMLKVFNLTPDFIYKTYPDNKDSYTANRKKRLELVKMDLFKNRFALRNHCLTTRFSRFKIVSAETLMCLTSILPSYGDLTIIKNLYFKRHFMKIVTYAAEEHIDIVKSYFMLCNKPGPIPMRYFISYDEIYDLGLRWSDYGNSCPICFFLSYITTEPDNGDYAENLVLYEDYSIWLCFHHYLFMAVLTNDKTYYRNRGPDPLFEPLVPVDISFIKEDPSRKYRNFCTTCLFLRKALTKKKFKKPNADLVIYYKQLYYYFCSIFCYKYFKRHIYQFANLMDRCKKLPLTDVDHSYMPVCLARMLSSRIITFQVYSHDLYNVMHLGLAYLDAFRPRFIGMNIRESACAFLAYFLLSFGNIDNQYIQDIAMDVFYKYKSFCLHYHEESGINLTLIKRNKYERRMFQKWLTADHKLNEFHKFLKTPEAAGTIDLNELKLEDIELRKQYKHLLLYRNFSEMDWSVFRIEIDDVIVIEIDVDDEPEPDDDVVITDIDEVD